MTDRERDDLLLELRDGFGRLESRMDAIEHRMGAMEHRMDAVERRVGASEHRLLDAINVVDNRVSDLRRDLSDHGMLPAAAG